METCIELEENRKWQRLLLKPKYFEIFNSDTKRILKEKSKVLRLVVEKMPFLRDIQIYRTDFVDCRKDTLRAYKLTEAHKQIYNELSELEEENLSDSQKQTFCNQLEELVKKLDEKYTELIRITRPEVRTQEFVNFSDYRSYNQDRIKQYRLSKDCGNQISLVLTTSVVDEDPNETVIDTENGVTKNAQENVEVSSRHSST